MTPEHECRPRREPRPKPEPRTSTRLNRRAYPWIVLGGVVLAQVVHVVAS